MPHCEKTLIVMKIFIGILNILQMNHFISVLEDCVIPYSVQQRQRQQASEKEREQERFSSQACYCSWHPRQSSSGSVLSEEYELSSLTVKCNRVVLHR